jgi:hypothetical protein
MREQAVFQMVGPPRDAGIIAEPHTARRQTSTSARHDRHQHRSMNARGSVYSTFT